LRILSRIFSRACGSERGALRHGNGPPRDDGLQKRELNGFHHQLVIGPSPQNTGSRLADVERREEQWNR
jgi:hypothetical protein